MFSMGIRKNNCALDIGTSGKVVQYRVQSNFTKVPMFHFEQSYIIGNKIHFFIMFVRCCCCLFFCLTVLVLRVNVFIRKIR